MQRIVLAVVLALSATFARAADRPNILVVITDDQRWDAMSVVQREQGDDARFAFFETPNMDRIAAEGVRFRNAFVTYSLCSPSRAVFLSGQYNHANGITDNKTPLSENLVTYASLLARAGYSTGYTGKWHMNGQQDRPGFDWAASFVGQGQYHDCPFVVNGEKVATTGWVDDVSTDYAIDFLKRQTDSKPFCLVVGYKTPHGPRTRDSVPERLRETYADAKIVPSKNASARPPYLKAGQDVLGNRREARRRGVSNPNSPVYFQLLKGVDENLGRLLATLDETGKAKNTIVVYTSDNGYFLGDHGIGDKRAAYDEALRIPLLIRLPQGRRGATVDAMTLNIDLAPTLLEMAGVDVPESMQGRSLKPLLDGTTPPDWRTSFLYEYFEERGFRVPTNFAIRTTKAKLIHYPGHEEWTEVFDLANDPLEMKNLAADPQHAELRKRLQAELERHARQLGLPLPLPQSPPE